MSVDDPLSEVVNAVQLVYLRTPGIRNAPRVNEWPTALDTFELPLALTDVARNSSWGLDCAGGRMKLNLKTSIYLQSFAQDFLGVIRQQVLTLAGAIHNQFLDESSYAYDDGTKRFIDREGFQVYLNTGVEMVFSGYMRLEYPVASQKFYHGFEVTYAVVADDISCGEDDL